MLFVRATTDTTYRVHGVMSNVNWTHCAPAGVRAAHLLLLIGAIVHIEHGLIAHAVVDHHPQHVHVDTAIHRARCVPFNACIVRVHGVRVWVARVHDRVHARWRRGCSGACAHVHTLAHIPSVSVSTVFVSLMGPSPMAVDADTHTTYRV